VAPRRVLAPLVAALLIVPLLPVRAGTPPGGWTKAVKIVSAADDMGHDAVVVNDRMHAVFAGDQGDADNTVSLYYGTNDNGGARWTWEVPKDLTSLNDLRPAIAVDENGIVYLAYHYRTASGEDVVEVASNEGGTWSFEVLAGPGGADIDGARFPDIALQADGSPAVVFTGLQQAPCAGNEDLYLSELSVGGWTPPMNVSINDTNCREHTFPALAGGSGGLHLVYRAVDEVTGEHGVHYRSGTLSNATDETVDEATDAAVMEYGVDVTGDGTGEPHVVYLVNAVETCCLQQVMYARRDGDVWSSTEVRAGDPLTVTGDPSIAISANGPAVSFTEEDDAFLAEDTTEGWTLKNLNSEAQENRSPVLASTTGQRLHALLIRDAAADSLRYMHEAPRARAEFAVAGTEFRGGQSVDMSGDIDPATVREKVKIETQKYRNGSWRAYDIVRFRTRANGSFDYTHAPFPGGRKYRSRLIWKDTIDHLDGRTVWDNFKVARKRAH